MATYIVGDVHGCYRTLRLLLEKLRFDRAADRLWLVGDLVNRGPSSLEVLRWASRLEGEIGGRFVCVLGNHDLHLLAQYAGLAGDRRDDDLTQVLEAPDSGELVAWLRARPLLHREGDLILVHAGLLPSWSVGAAESKARSVERLLAAPGGLAALLGRGPAEPELAAARRALAVFTRLRTCTEEERLCSFSGPPEQAPAGCLPWFRFPGRRTAGQRVVFGHWAALGLHEGPGVVALDSGCSWGGCLSALALGESWERRRIVQQPVHPSEAPGRREQSS